MVLLFVSFSFFFTQETCLNTCDSCAPEARTGIRENSLWSVHLWDLWNFLWNFFFLTRGARLEEQGWRKEGGERTMVMDGWLVLFFMYNKMDYWAAGRRQRVGEKEEWKKNAEWQKDQCLPNKQLLAFASVTLVHVATTARKVVDTRIQIHSIPIREEK